MNSEDNLSGQNPVWKERFMNTLNWKAWENLFQTRNLLVQWVSSYTGTLTRRNQHVFIILRWQNVNIFTQGDYGRSECDKIILITAYDLKTNSLSPWKYICPNLQSLSEDSSEKEFLKSS